MAGIDAKKIVERGRAAFRAGKTMPPEARIKHLKDCRRMIKEHRQEFIDALHKDLRKPSFEGIGYEIMLGEQDITLFIDEVEEWTKPQHVPLSLLTLGKSAYNVWEPLGLSLIIGAWNYPFQLTIQPLVAAMVAGNTAILKPSEMSPATASLLEKLIPQYLDNDCYQVVNGDAVVTTALLEQKFDHILYTGNGTVGKIVMTAAAKHLTPVTLELGGKSPCYIDSNSNIAMSAKRAAWGRFINSGQTCIAPDYIMCHQKDAAKVVEGLRQAINDFFGSDPKTSKDYCRIVNQRHFKRLLSLLEGQNVVVGGETDEKDLYIAPTVILNPDITAKCMTDEIFGPIFPVITVSGVEEAIKFVNDREKPLALYAFCNDRKVLERISRETSSGAFIGNDTLIHAGIPTLPFGGVGGSGMGSYHGRFSFETFSHKKPVIIDKSVWVSEKAIGMRYPPYTPRTEALLQWVLKKSPKRDYVGTFLRLTLLGFLLAVIFKFFGLEEYLPAALKE